MNPRRRAFAPALTALSLTFASPSQAAERACPTPSVESDASFVARFPDLIDRLRSELSNRPDLDACARIELRTTDTDAIEVSVTLPDGRHATRVAARGEDVLPSLQSLLLLPQRGPVLPNVAAREAPPIGLRLSRLSPLAPALRERDAPVSVVEPRRFGIELSLQGGTRMGEAQLAVGLGALSLLEAHGWLFGFTSRVDRYQTPLSDPEMGLELGVLGGRRFYFDGFALDFLAGPAVAMKGLAFSETQAVRVGSEPPVQPPAQMPSIPEDPSTGPVPRLLLGAHVGFTPRSVVRSFVGAEASLGPARGDDNPNQGSARFPVVMLGLVLGATVGTK